MRRDRTAALAFLFAAASLLPACGSAHRKVDPLDDRVTSLERSAAAGAVAELGMELSSVLPKEARQGVLNDYRQAADSIRFGDGTAKTTAAEKAAAERARAAAATALAAAGGQTRLSQCFVKCANDAAQNRLDCADLFCCRQVSLCGFNACKCACEGRTACPNCQTPRCR